MAARILSITALVIATASLAQATTSTDESMCSNGIPGIEHKGACCPTGCGRCGGYGCITAGGLTADDCCVFDILDHGVACSEAGAAPCYLDDVDSTPSPSTTGRGIGDGDDTPAPLAVDGEAGDNTQSPAAAVGGGDAPNSTPSPTTAGGGADAPDSTPYPSAAGGGASSGSGTLSPSVPGGSGGGPDSTPSPAAAGGGAGSVSGTPSPSTAGGGGDAPESTPSPAAAGGGPGSGSGTPSPSTAGGGGDAPESTPSPAAAGGGPGSGSGTPSPSTAGGGGDAPDSTSSPAAAGGGTSSGSGTPSPSTAGGGGDAPDSTPSPAAAGGGADSGSGTPSPSAASGAAGAPKSTPSPAAAGGEAGGESDTPSPSVAGGSGDASVSTPSPSVAGGGGAASDRTPSPTVTGEGASSGTGTPSPAMAVDRGISNGTLSPSFTPSPTAGGTLAPGALTEEPLVSATACDELKSAIEAGESGTYELASDITCYETITIVEGQDVTLTSASDTSDGKYSITPASSFTGGTSPTTSTESDGGAGGDFSMFVVENGGSLNAVNVIFDSSPSLVGSTTITTMTSSTSITETATDSSPSTSASETSTVGSTSTSATDTTTIGTPTASTADTSINGSTSTADTSTTGSSGITSTNVTATIVSPTSSTYEGGGGVRAIYTAGNVTVDNCNFMGQGDGATAAVMNGGAIYMADADVALNGPSSVTCIDSTFNGHSVDGSGGAIYAEGSGPLYVSGSLFDDNSAGGDGDGDDVGADGTDTTTDSATDTSATGGGEYGSGTNATTDSTTGSSIDPITDSANGTATDSTTDTTTDTIDSDAGAGAGGGGSGGAIYAGPDVELDVSNTTFEGNSATDGGAIASYGGTLSDIIVSNTNTSEDGFGAVVSNGPGGNSSTRGLDISGSSFEDNSGGAAAAFNTDVNITSSEFIDNDGAVYFETSDSERGYKLQMEDVEFEGNGPAPVSWGSANVSTNSGDMICKDNGDGEVVSSVKLLGVDCAEEGECAMTVDEEAFEVTGDTECGVCNEDGEAITVTLPDEITTPAEDVEPLVSATACDELKSAIEAGESGTYELASDITCYETITIVEGQDVTLTSASDASDGKYSITPASSFTGGTSPTTSTESDGGAGGDFSMFVVENGGSLNAVNVIFDSSPSLVGSTTITTMTSSTSITETATDSSPSTSASETSTVGSTSTSATDTTTIGTPTASTADTSINGSTSTADTSTTGSSGITSTNVTATIVSPTSSTYEGGGGVRAIYTAGNVTVDNCNFMGQGDGATAAVMNGGAIYMADADVALNGPSSVTCIDSTFNGHSVDGSGGAIYAEGSGPLYVSGSLFDDNSAGGDGDGDDVGADGTDTTTDSATDTSATGGGEYGSGTNATTDSTTGSSIDPITDSANGTATDSTTDTTTDTIDSDAGAGAGGGGSGGAIYAGPDVELDVSNTTFEGNSATDGGAIASYGGTLSDIIVSNTNTSEDGFGAVVSNDPGGNSSTRGLDISGSSFEDNSGGAAAAFNTDVNITSSEFIDNDGAVYFETSDSERGYKLQMEDVEFEGNGPAPVSWGSANVSTNSGDMICKDNGDGEVVSSVKLLGVDCAEEGECAMTVDEEAFEVTGDTECGVCNEDGEAITVTLPDEITTPAEDGGSKDYDYENAGFIVGMCFIGILVCACCVGCGIFAAKKRSSEENRPAATAGTTSNV